MGYVQPNRLLPPTSRVIKSYQCSFLAVEGPNILGKLNLGGVEIPYESQFTTRMVLNPGAVNQPLLYGFLGTDVTFILLKVTYDETNPICNIEEEQFIEYYFEDQTSVKRYINKLLILTGNSVHRIPQIYLNNPGETKVYVDAMVANLAQSDFTPESADIITITNLYHNSILSDKVWMQTNFTSGSCQLQIMNSDDIIQLYLDYSDILSIETVYENYELVITTVSDSNIILRFLNLFEMYQARSRINWVMKSPIDRFLTADNPSVDIIPPVIIINPYILPISTNTYVYPYTSGSTVTPTNLINFFISGITDERDGIISVTNTNVTIRKYGEVESLTGITTNGVYDIVLSVSDNANNKTSCAYILICDTVPPVITFKSVASGSVFNMTTSDMTQPNLGISPNDIRTKSIDYVYDTVDGYIANSAVTITISYQSSAVSYITIPGEYTVTYEVSDRGGNTSTYHKSVIYSGYVVFNSGDTYYFGNNLTTMDFRYIGGVGTNATIIISGHSYIISSVSGTTNEELVWDFGGLDEYNFGSGSTGTHNITIEGILYTIRFTGRGSLLFTITNNGVSSEYFSVNPSILTFEYQSGLTQTFTITTNKIWQIEPGLSLVSVSQTSGITTTIITVTTLSENSGSGDLSEMIEILVDDGTIHEEKSISVVQHHI